MRRGRRRRRNRSVVRQGLGRVGGQGLGRDRDGGDRGARQFTATGDVDQRVLGDFVVRRDRLQLHHLRQLLDAARLFQNWMCSAEGQQTLVDISAQYVPHGQAKPKPGRRPLGDIKAMKDDPAAVLTQADEIKAKYTAIFKV